MENQTLMHAIKTARARKGLTLQQIADELGVSYPAVQQWESGKTRPSMKNLIRLQGMLGADLINGGVPISRPEPFDDFEKRVAPTLYTPEPNVVMEGPVAKQWPGALPRVQELGIGVASINGDESAFQFNGQAIDHVTRPPGLANRADVFALRVANLSMWPRFRDGERIYVDSKRPAIEDFVVVELKPTIEGVPGNAYVKMLVARDSRKLTVEQFNPPGRLEFGHDEVLRTFRVIPTEELWG